MRKHISRIVYVFIFSLSLLAIAAEGAKPTPPTPSPPHQPTSTEAELKLKEREISVMQSYHSSLLDTVYWSLGTMAAMAALLVGFGWYANFKFHESEKQRLHDDLEDKINLALSSIDSRLISHEAKVINSIDFRLESHNSRFAKEIDATKEEAAEISSRLSAFTQEQEKAIAQILKSIGKGEKRDLEIEATIRQIEEHIWDIKNMPENILITQSQGLDAAIRAQSKDYIKSILARMHETISNTILPQNITTTETMKGVIIRDVTDAIKFEPVAANEVIALLKRIGTD